MDLAAASMATAVAAADATTNTTTTTAAATAMSVASAGAASAASGCAVVAAAHGGVDDDTTTSAASTAAAAWEYQLPLLAHSGRTAGPKSYESSPRAIGLLANYQDGDGVCCRAHMCGADGVRLVGEPLRVARCDRAANHVVV